MNAIARRAELACQLAELRRLADRLTPDRRSLRSRAGLRRNHRDRPRGADQGPDPWCTGRERTCREGTV